MFNVEEISCGFDVHDVFAGLHARLLHRFPNGKLKQIGPQMVQDGHMDNSVLKHVNTDVKPKKQLLVPSEFYRQGTEPSRRFLVDLNTGMLKRGVDETNTRVSGCMSAKSFS